MSITIEGADAADLAKISKILGLSPRNIKVSTGAFAAPGSDGPDWTPETARQFVDGLKRGAFTVVGMLCENDGIVGLDEVMNELGLDSGKALGGVMSSVGHNISRLVDAGLLPEGTTIMLRDEEAHQFLATVNRRVLNLISTAVNRRARIQVVADVA
ncbi:MAG: hypothetical protein LH616_08350 [Ilumatobacteraceae bacterium]|nr:hypothetical protein [Ilumatobacteraceae bacterium]